MKKLLSQIASAWIGLWLATIFIPLVKINVAGANFFGFDIATEWGFFLLLGFILGLLNFFIKPVIKTITLPLRVITLGLFSIVINMAMIWIIDAMFSEISIPIFWPLLWTSLLIWALNFIFEKTLAKKDDY